MAKDITRQREQGARVGGMGEDLRRVSRAELPVLNPSGFEGGIDEHHLLGLRDGVGYEVAEKAKRLGINALLMSGHMDHIETLTSASHSQ